MTEPPREFDDYVITRELGRGQMGQVFLAEDVVLARQVAIKLIAGVAPDLHARQRFLMEARAAARIQHPNVATVYRVGEHGDRPYIVSELIRGVSLADLPRPMAPAAALEIAIELARGLAAAHRRGVVHCDIKPRNVMVADDGVAKLVDFGLARVLHDASSESTGGLVGTPDYLAPEIWDGRSPTRRSDVYSLGALLFELIAGAPPFADVPPTELGGAVRERPAPELRDLDPRLAQLVARCLERDPEMRFPSGEELREALEQLHPSRALAVRRDENPYRGLRTFEQVHRALFFGRALETGSVIERMRTDGMVIVAGDSGVGKSSLCRAGVVPAVLDGALGAGRAWEAVTIVPGRRPLVALAAALGDPAMASRVLEDPEALPRELHRRAGSRSLLLFIDQLEELVTVGDPAEVAALEAGLARISEGIPGVRVLASVRADFLSRIAALPRLGRELSRLLFFLSPLPPERLHDVITAPATATGVQFESPELVELLVEATAQAGSGGLPLLSFALAELWEARDRQGSVITRTALDRMGGVAGALARHADAVLAGLPAVDRGRARRLLLRLVSSSGTRVRRTESELTVDDDTRHVLDALVGGRLLVAHDGDGDATYEVAHEVMVHGWGTLREWLAADTEERAVRERLAAAAAEWRRAGRRADLTWRGSHLGEARALDRSNLTALEREFVAASARLARRRTWLLRGAVLGVIGLVVLAAKLEDHRAGRRLETAVAEQMESAHRFLDEAHASKRHQRELEAAAYGKFDTGARKDGETLWKDVIAARATTESGYRHASERIEAALAKDPTRDDVRGLLGEVLLDRAVLADAVHDLGRADELIGRLAAYDPDGSRIARWNQPGRLAVEAPAGAVITLEPSHRKLGVGGADVVLAPGSYVLELTAAGRESVRAPILVQRGEQVRLDLEMPRAGALPPGFVFVPAGAFLFGSSTDENTRIGFLEAAPLHPRQTGAYLIGSTEVTIADWLVYVDTQAGTEQAGLLPKISSPLNGALVIERDRGGWSLKLQPMLHAYTARWGQPIEYTGRTRRAKQDWRRFPITGISAADAEAYASWLARTGRVPGARLCTELEWERAARGADGRTFPHGERLEPDDANIDVTYGGDLVGPDEVGAHPTSTSVFGLADMVGNAFEWTREDQSNGYIVKSGSYYHNITTAYVANRSSLNPGMRDATVGVRLCATVSAESLR